MYDEVLIQEVSTYKIVEFAARSIILVVLKSHKLKGAVSPTFSVIFNSQKTYLYGCKRQNNGSVLLTIILAY